MNIGGPINNLRKKNGLSQDDFAELFHVSRQTVSNWENAKSYPDLETILRISDYFNISVDELLKNDHQAVVTMDNEKRKKKQYLILLIVLIVLGVAVFMGLYVRYRDSIAVDFTMSRNETYQGKETEGSSMDIAEGYFSVPGSGKLDVRVEGLTDDGKLHVTILNEDDDVCYRLDGQELDDDQTLHFEKGSYMIRIGVDGYTEEVISLDYRIEIQN